MTNPAQKILRAPPPHPHRPVAPGSLGQKPGFSRQHQCSFRPQLCMSSSLSFFFFFFSLLLEREERGKGGREREIVRLPSGMHPYWGSNQQLDMCPDWELNLRSQSMGLRFNQLSHASQGRDTLPVQAVYLHTALTHKSLFFSALLS